MRCEEARELISRDVDGELPGDRRAELEQHVKSCGDCARFAEDCRKLQSAMRASPVPMPDERYWNALPARAAQSAAAQSKRGEGRVRLLRMSWYVAAAAGLLLVIGVVTQQSQINDLRAQVAQLRIAEAKPQPNVFDPQTVTCPVPHVPVTALREQEAVFNDLAPYFQGGLKWMVEDGSQADVGVSEDVPLRGATHTAKPMIAQLQLVRLGSDGTTQVISSPTVAILPGAEARFNLEASNGNGSVRLPYRCVLSKSNGGPATLTVSLDLNPPLEGHSAKLSGVAQLHPGNCVPVAYTRAGGVGYALFAALLPDSGTSTDKAGI